MKSKLLTYAIFQFAVCQGISQEVTRQVTASAGHSATVGYTVFQYTIGEPLTTTLEGSTVLLTQGFQQPEVAGPMRPPESPFISDFIVYPNPASDRVNLEFDLLQDGAVVFMLINNAGQIVFSQTSQMLAGRLTYTLPLGSYASGIYYVVVRTGYRSYTEKLIIQ